jgi:hypothetical protein
MLILQCFMAPATEAKAPARFFKGGKKEARFSRTATVPLAEDIHYGSDMDPASHQRRHGHTGSLTVASFIEYRTTVVTPPGAIQSKESFCIPIALRLLFPGHYFW